MRRPNGFKLNRISYCLCFLLSLFLVPTLVELLFGGGIYLEWLTLTVFFIFLSIGRLHDAGKSRWWSLLAIIPLWFNLYLLFLPSRSQIPTSQRKTITPKQKIDPALVDQRHPAIEKQEPLMSEQGMLVSTIKICPLCGVKVIPRADGTCPNCKSKIS